MIGIDESAAGVDPSHQSLDGYHLAGGQVDLGLIVEEKFLASNRIAQFVIQKGNDANGCVCLPPFRSVLLLEQCFECSQLKGLLQLADDVETLGPCHLIGGLEDTFAYSAHEDYSSLAALLCENTPQLNAVQFGHPAIKKDQ